MKLAVRRPFTRQIRTWKGGTSLSGLKTRTWPGRSSSTAVGLSNTCTPDPLFEISWANAVTRIDWSIA